MAEQDVLVVIPCLNESSHIESLIRQILNNYQKSKVVIADGGSSDGTRDIVKRLSDEDGRVSLLDNPKKIQSAGVNLAIEEFGEGYECFIRLDAHATYPEDFIAQLMAEFDRSSADSVVVSMKSCGSSRFQEMVAITQNSRLGNGGSAHRKEVLQGQWVNHGHHALMRVSAFRAVGGYDESYIANEDFELDHRLTQAGYRIWHTAETVMSYYPRSTLTSLFAQYHRNGVGVANHTIQHKKSLKLRQALPMLVFPSALLLLLVPINHIFFLPIAAWTLVCAGYGLVLGVRNRSVYSCLSGLAAAAMHMGWSLGFCRELVKVLRSRLQGRAF
ncbi:glycosyltransferase family 2 protein [Endozoicomonas arenosclerae]|uniref:glycosyltransferase family 2 protein n=1 Tax=Endozoicomonas arenosclerae TaxID=1633495 RepID=UPI0007862135|nr:glycosyltransferase family 2 protein [Endozoicomonas arenosclerae]